MPEAPATGGVALLLLLLAAGVAGAQTPSPTQPAPAAAPAGKPTPPPTAAQARDSTAGPVPAKPARPPEWGLVADFAFNGASGNTSMAVLSSSVRISHERADAHEFEFTVAYDYGVSGGRTIQRREQSGLKFDLYPHATWSPFVFTGIEREPARRIDKQAFGGAGLKFVFWSSLRGKASISLATLYNYENSLVAPQSALLPARDRTARWSLRFKGARTLGGSLKLENTTFYQPVWDRAGDYNIDATTSLSAQATKSVTLFLRHSYRRDSTPLASVLPVDQRVSAGLGFKL